MTFGVTGADGEQATAAGMLRIAPRLAITTQNLGTVRVGSAYTRRLATRGGVRPVSWRVVNGALPLGLKLDRTTGVLSGKPSRAGTYRFSIRATDRLGGTSTKKLGISVVE